MGQILVEAIKEDVIREILRDEVPPPGALHPKQKEVQQFVTYFKRKAKARFYADENFPEQAISLLRAMGAKVQTNYEAGLSRRSDQDQLAHALRNGLIAHALRNGLILVTCDRDFLDERRYPLVHCPAIFVFDFGSGTLDEMKQAFTCLAAVFRTPRFYDKWCKVDAKRDCWTEMFRHLDGTTSRKRLRLLQGKLQEWVD